MCEATRLELRVAKGREQEMAATGWLDGRVEGAWASTEHSITWREARETA